MGEVDIRGDRVKARRMALQLTQEQLAELTGTDQRTISRLEKGIQALTIRSLVNLSSALQTNIEWLLGLSDNVLPWPIMAADLDDIEQELLGLLRKSDPSLREKLITAIRAVAALAQR